MPRSIPVGTWFALAVAMSNFARSAPHRSAPWAAPGGPIPSLHQTMEGITERQEQGKRSEQSDGGDSADVQQLLHESRLAGAKSLHLVGVTKWK